MTRTLLAALLAGACLAATAAHGAEPGQGQSILVKLQGAWKGYLPRGDEYVEYIVSGAAEPKDGTHIQTRPGQMMMLTFADKKDLAPGKNLLEAHREWELSYWREQTNNKVESRNRDDLAQGQSGLMVTEIRLPQPDGPGSFSVYMIAAAADNGVFVFAISPVTPEDDAAVKKFIATIKVVRHPLDPRDLAAEARKNQPRKQGAKTD